VFFEDFGDSTYRENNIAHAAGTVANGTITSA